VRAPSVALGIEPLQRPRRGAPLLGILSGVAQTSQAADFALDRGPAKLLGERRVALRGTGDCVKRAADVSGSRGPRAPDGENFADFAALGLVEQRLAARAAVLVEGDQERNSQRFARGSGADSPRNWKTL
jgi:hypothetical protein